jgi:hypothetical protein
LIRRQARAAHEARRREPAPLFVLISIERPLAGAGVFV